MEQEIWKDIPNYEGLYQASTLGRIKRVKRYNKGRAGCKRLVNEKVLKFLLDRRGYYYSIILFKNNHKRRISIHRLVALTFITNPSNKPQVNHINGNKKDNRAINLEWCTNSENQLHAYKIGLKVIPDGEINANSKLSNLEVEYIKELYNYGKTISEISKIKNIPIGRLRSIFYGQSWKSHSVQIDKRDGRSDRSKELYKRLELKRFNNKSKCANIIVAKVDKITGKETIYKSVKEASDKTGIPRTSIRCVVNRTKIPHSKNKDKYTILTEAGGYFWRKVEGIDLNTLL